MPIVKDIQEDGVRVLLWRIVETELDLRDMLGDDRLKLPENPQRRLERLAVLNLMRGCGLPVPYGYDPAGRPVLDGGGPNISVSHTRRYAAVAISTEAPVGIDVEQADRNFQRVSSKYLSSSEQGHEPNAEELAATWCAKEALYKLPWSSPLVLSRDVELSIGPDDIAQGHMQATVHSGGKSHTLALRIARFDDHLLAWVKG